MAIPPILVVAGEYDIIAALSEDRTRPFQRPIFRRLNSCLESRCQRRNAPAPGRFWYKAQERAMSKPTPAAPQTQKPRTPVRMPQRSEEVSGDERHEKSRPIAAEQKKKPKPH
jgi:hypothetical protein